MSWAICGRTQFWRGYLYRVLSIGCLAVGARALAHHFANLELDDAIRLAQASLAGVGEP